MFMNRFVRAQRLLALVMSTLLLSACQSYQLPVPTRPTFPLPACGKTHLDAAIVAAVQPQARDLPETTALCATGRNEAAPKVDEGDLRIAVEGTFLREMGITDGNSPGLGLSLAGGGSKAGSMAMGLLAAVANQDAMKQLDFISTVSGGGYAAYFLYAHASRRVLNGQAANTRELFVDCIRDPADYGFKVEKDFEEELRLAGLCATNALTRAEPEAGDPSLGDNRLQAFVRCKQNMLDPFRCSALDADDSTGSRPGLYAQWLLTMPWGALNNVFWDTGLGTSTVGLSYRNGIGIAYGADPGAGFRFPIGGKSAEGEFRIDCQPRAGKGQLPSSGAARQVDGCVPGGMPAPWAESLSFDELRRAFLLAKGQPGGERLPYWIINASGTNQRSLPGWFSGYQRSAAQDAFEMTPVLHGSGRYGFVPAAPTLHKMDVLDSVIAGASFLDANEQLLPGRIRGAAGVLLHFTNLNWGMDIRNYNVNDTRAATHATAPFPFYLIDRFQQAGEEPPVSARAIEDPKQRQAKIERERSAFIRLTDGGSSEDMGLLALERRNVRNIVVGDLSGDDGGRFADLCQVRREMLARPEPSNLKAMHEHPERYRRHLVVPGLRDLESVCDGHGEAKLGYDLRDWTFSFPVLLGCIRSKAPWIDGAIDCERLGAEDIRLFIVKPVIDLQSALEAVKSPPSSETSFTLKRCWTPKPATDADLAPSTPRTLPCEVLGFIAHDYAKRSRPLNHCPSFPQHSTVQMTANSDPWRYAVYRELGRQYGGLALHLASKTASADGGDAAPYEALLTQQRDEAIAPLQPRMMACLCKGALQRSRVPPKDPKDAINACKSKQEHEEDELTVSLSGD